MAGGFWLSFCASIPSLEHGTKPRTGTSVGQDNDTHLQLVQYSTSLHRYTLHTHRGTAQERHNGSLCRQGRSTSAGSSLRLQGYTSAKTERALWLLPLVGWGYPQTDTQSSTIHPK